MRPTKTCHRKMNDSSSACTRGAHRRGCIVACTPPSRQVMCTAIVQQVPGAIRDALCHDAQRKQERQRLLLIAHQRHQKQVRSGTLDQTMQRVSSITPPHIVSIVTTLTWTHSQASRESTETLEYAPDWSEKRRQTGSSRAI